MSTISRSASVVVCDGTDSGQPCPLDSDTLGLSGGVATTIRKRLKRAGWAVNLTNPEPRGEPRRLDYCDRHKSAPRGGRS